MPGSLVQRKLRPFPMVAVDSIGGALLLSLLRGENRTNSAEIDSTLFCQQLTAEACALGIAPFAYHVLAKRSDIPVTTKKALCGAYLATTARNRELLRDLSHVLDRFHAESIDTIVMKGIHLATAVYEHIGLRPMGDIDLLVRKTDLERARQIMLNIGYAQSQQQG